VAPICDDFVAQHRLLDRLVCDSERTQSVDALRRYFRDSGPARDLFSGRWFNRSSGGGDALEVADVVTAADVLALTHLSMSDLSELAVAVLERRAAEVNALLPDIPRMAMHEVTPDDYDTVLGRQSAAWRLWELLRACAGENRWVSASKLLARKRPHLLPVYDNVVKQELDGTNRIWACLWCWFQGDLRRVDALEALRAEVGGIEDVSLLRCLDVVLWMRGSGR
jgi:hypothetical protein